MGKTTSAEVKWKADRMSSSCQGLSSQLVSEKKSRTCLPWSVCTHSSCSSLRICCPLHYQTRLSLHSSSSQLCPTTLKPTHSLCSSLPPHCRIVFVSSVAFSSQALSLLPAPKYLYQPSYYFLYKIHLSCTCPLQNLKLAFCIKHFKK